MGFYAFVTMYTFHNCCVYDRTVQYSIACESLNVRGIQVQSPARGEGAASAGSANFGGFAVVEAASPPRACPGISKCRSRHTLWQGTAAIPVRSLLSPPGRSDACNYARNTVPVL